MKYLRHDKKLKKLGIRIKKIREEQSLSQVQLAFESGVPEIQIRRIEKGTVNTGVSSLFALSEALNIEIKELFEI